MGVICNTFSEFREKRTGLEEPVSAVLQNLSEFDSILLYGAGSSGIAVLDFLRRQGIEPAFFVDSDALKVGTICEGVSVIAPETVVKTVKGSFLVIVCINTDGIRYCKSFDEALRVGGHHGVYDKLHRCGCKNVIDYTFFRRCFALFKGEKYNAPSCSDVDLMLAHQEEIEETYKLLADDLSRDIFERIVRFRLLDDTLKIPTMPQEQQYFEPDFYRSREDAAFVDCGAFNGISLNTFLRVNGGKFSDYYGIEPDPDNYVRLKQFVSDLPSEQREKIHLSRLAAWEDDNGAKLYALHGPGSFMAQDIGKTMVSTARIDALLAERPATFIKMNIEGSEKQALRGAEQTIRTYKPQLAIAGYHRTNDLWEIPLMIKRYREDYRLSLRSYMNHLSFVYYAE